MSSSLPSLFKIDLCKNQLVSTIIQKNVVTPNNFYFTDECKIEIPKFIEVVNNDTTIKKNCTYSKNFTDSYVLFLSNTDLEISSKFLIPYFSSQKFRCLTCNKIHDGKTNKCCSMEKSIILLDQAKLYKVEIPKLSDVEKSLNNSREEFIRLHFVDFLDTIMLR